MSKDNSLKQFIPALTGYRAIAAWMIFVLHFFPSNNPLAPEYLKSFVKELHIGVDMFFVLSGFLITFRYFDQHPINFKKYMVNRFARIYPMYFMVTLGVFAVFLLQNGNWNSEKTIEAILSFTMTKALFQKYFFSAGISQGWTLTLEELFYITAPFYFILLRKKSYWFFVLPVLIFLFGLVLKVVSQTPENTWGFMQKNISYYIFEFFIGIGLALMVNNKLKLKLKGTTYFGISFIILFLLTLPTNYTESDWMKAAMAILLCSFGIAPLIWGLIFEDTFIKRFLSSKLMVLLGKSSYIFYLIHKGFIPMLIYDYIAENVLLIFVLLNILSIIMFKYLEEPLNLWIRKKFAK
ncbi:acyltransferase [Chryseobacterium sp. SNU WT5]|uniref:acyltransferase family protein n=1 Tax=Chryseobacterium sp. SNU WT5 TaxID=2594269 RepID=UPI0011800099|nr:acyltransferase [Chryseobacterium sp. SNU WT5]QDP85532.1 acyltransferase [Chryseobacterium sp. SNU WT5]